MTTCLGGYRPLTIDLCLARLFTMSIGSFVWAFGAAFGAWLMIHCPRAALTEYRNGIAKGLDPRSHNPKDFVRVIQPLGFWLTIVGTFLAGLMGLCFFLISIAFYIYA